MAGLFEKNLERMLNDSKFSDIILLSSDGQKFHAASRVLQNNCPYFMVAQNLEKATNGVLAMDIRGKILAEVRRWIYIKVIDVHKFELEDFLDLHSFADSYGIEDLKDKAGDLLNEYPISEENVLRILERADQVGNQKLIKRCKDYLCQNIPSILQNPKVFNRIPSDLIIEINQKVSFHKLPNFYLAIGKWAKGRQNSLARKVLQETLNVQEMPKAIMVDIIETMLLKDDDIFTEQVVHTLTSQISNSLPLSDRNSIKLDNIDNIIWNDNGQVKEISKEMFYRILNTDRGIWFHVESCFDYDKRQFVDILFNKPVLVNRLSWKLGLLTDLICVALFRENGEKVWSAIVREKTRTIFEDTRNCAASKLTWENPVECSPNQLSGVILNETLQIRKIRFEFATTFSMNSLFANCVTI